MQFDCHFQDIFSEIIPHRGNILLITLEILTIAVWGDYVIGKHRSYFPCRVDHNRILLRSVIFHFWKSDSTKKSTEMYLHFKIKFETASPLNQFTLKRSHSSRGTLPLSW